MKQVGHAEIQVLGTTSRYLGTSGFLVPRFWQIIFLSKIGTQISAMNQRQRYLYLKCIFLILIRYMPNTSLCLVKSQAVIFYLFFSFGFFDLEGKTFGICTCTTFIFIIILFQICVLHTNTNLPDINSIFIKESGKPTLLESVNFPKRIKLLSGYFFQFCDL